jgi:peptidoglycan/xylan/chitin deacetylase (PgdA/CDA1 family)
MTPLYLFPGGKPKAVTFSYDDGTIHDKRLVEIFNRYGLKATFNINSGMKYPEKMDQSEFAKVYAGHEIAAHAEFHAGLDRCAATDAMREVWNDRAVLEKICGYPVTGFAYPCGQYSQAVIDILKAAGFEYARTVREQHSARYIPGDFMQWDATSHHRDALKYMDAFLNEKRMLLQIFYVWGHSYEFDRDNNWELIEEICQKLSGKEDTWYAANIEICRYIKAVRSLVSGANGQILYNPTAQTVWFTADGWDAKDIRSIAPGETLVF